MILHGIFESRFESEEALVDGCGILAVERDHLGPRFAASDDLERVRFDTLDDGVGDSRGRFAFETELGSGPVRFHHRGVSPAGVNGQHVNVFALELASERLAKVSKTGLRGGVRRIERRADQGDAGRDIHHHRVAARAQRGEHGARQQDRRDEIYIYHGPQFGFGRLLEASGSHAARVVDQDVETSERFESVSDRRGAAVRTRDVGRDAPDMRIVFPQLLDRLRESVGPPARDDDFRALGQKSVREREADPARPASDEDSLTVDVHACASMSLSWVLFSKSLASWRSWSCFDGSPLVRLTTRPRFTAGRARMVSAQRWTFL